MIGAGRARERDGEARHALLRYDSPECLCARAVPYVREGLARGEAVVAVVSAEVEQVLGSALGDAAAGVGWQAEDVSYGRLGVMFEGFRRFLAEQRAPPVCRCGCSPRTTRLAPGSGWRGICGSRPWPTRELVKMSV